MVILDVDMPGRNGMETAAWIRQFESEGSGKHVPIIGLTGYEGKDVERECKEAGMDQVMKKPIKRAELVEMLETFGK